MGEKLIRVIANAHKYGGGEMSVGYIMSMLCDAGHRVVLHPTDHIGPNVDEHLDERIERGRPFWNNKEKGCDVLLFYANNFNMTDHRATWVHWFANAARRVACLNWGIGCFYDKWYHDKWDSIAFLNTYLRNELFKYGWRGESFVQAPAMDLAPYLNVEPDYDAMLFCRHDRAHKWGGFRPRIERADIAVHYMGAPSQFVQEDWCEVLYEEFAIPPFAFLQGKACFIHWIPEKATEQGPRTIVEAMASGLPVITEPRGGMLDRVASDRGWFFQSPSEFYSIVNSLTPGELEQKGRRARAYAASQCHPSYWADWVLGS